MDHSVTIYHKELAGGRWRKLSLCEQLANVGSEISRALNWRNKGNPDYSREAVYRALELLDFTLDSVAATESEYRYCRLREIARVREAVVDFFMGSNQFDSTEALWRKYFDYFAYAARKNR